MMQKSGAADDDTDGIAGLPRQIEGVKIGLTLNEKDSGVFKVSCRSAGDVDVSGICRCFGGGGHKAAAGCVINAPYEEAKQRLVDAARKALKGEL